MFLKKSAAWPGLEHVEWCGDGGVRRDAGECRACPEAPACAAAWSGGTVCTGGDMASEKGTNYHTNW